jgi:hypothetical protein
MDQRYIDILSRLNRATSELSYETKSHQGDIETFIASDFGLSRLPSAGPGSRGSRTGSSFAALAFANADLLRSLLDRPAWDQVPTFFAKRVAADLVPLPPAASARPDPHLNEYSIPIWTAALFTIAKIHPPTEDALFRLGNLTGVVSSIASELIRNNGCLRRISLSPQAPSSAFLTYGAVTALALADDGSRLIDVSAQPQITAALDSAASWAEAALSQLISDHHANLLSRFDVVEFICAACIVWRLKHRGQGRPADDLAELSTYAVGLVLDHYIQNGLVKLSRPVFADEKHNAVLCPTSEALLLILSSFPSDVLATICSVNIASNSTPALPRWTPLMEAFAWYRRNRRKNGYPPDISSPFSVRDEATVFTTSSTIAFFSLLERVLDALADQVAKEALNVSSVPPRAAYIYPEDLGKLVRDKVVAYMADPTRRPFAKHSIILHGPPGTAKTSIARQIAADLKWPLKIITQSDFLKAGRDKIETEADHIFTACGFLKNVVVLFDELEELILSRDAFARDIGAKVQREGIGADLESRLLTTSMLPKIHELRDRRRIVFIFATNRLARIDHAATRLGRFDIIYGVDYPASNLLMQAADEHLTRVRPLCGGQYDEIANFVRSIDFEYQTRIQRETKVLLTYKDVEYILEEVVSDYVEGYGKPDWEPPWDRLNGLIVQRHNANKEGYDAFTDLKERGDRI